MLHSFLTNPNLIPGLYLVVYDDYKLDEYDSFVVVACSQEEASKLTPDEQINHSIGTELGYKCPEFDWEHVEFYRDHCGKSKSIRRVGDAWAELHWGDVVIASYNPG